MGQFSIDSPRNMVFRVAVLFATLAASCHCGLLGAGYGAGSCFAVPYRSKAVDHAAGCPASAPCCSEYGYCQPEANWKAGMFRDCNGVSNGTPLPADAIEAEAAAAAQGDANARAILAAAAGLGVGTVGLGAGAAGSGAGAAGFSAGAAGLGAGAAGFGAGAAGLGAGAAGADIGAAGLGAGAA